MDSVKDLQSLLEQHSEQVRLTIKCFFSILLSDILKFANLPFIFTVWDWSAWVLTADFIRCSLSINWKVGRASWTQRKHKFCKPLRWNDRCTLFIFVFFPKSKRGYGCAHHNTHWSPWLLHSGLKSNSCGAIFLVLMMTLYINVPVSLLIINQTFLSVHNIKKHKQKSSCSLKEC